MRTLAPPVGQGWEYLTGAASPGAATSVARPAGLGLRRRAGPSCPSCSRRSSRPPRSRPGRYDLVIDPTNLWLTIHESIGHATELDRALGYEAAYAGTVVRHLDKLGTLRYGSPRHERDRRPHRPSTAWPPSATTTRAWPRQSWDLITRRHPGRLPARPADGAQLNGFGRSNGCAFADSPGHVPIQRMANVSLQPAADGPAPGRADRRRRGRHLHRRRQVLVDRHAAVQLPVHRPAVLPDPRAAGWPGSCATSPTRPPPPTSGTRWRPSAGRRPTCSAARSTAARASPGRSPRSATAARRRSSAGCGSSTPFRKDEHDPERTRSPQELVERALAEAGAGD